MSKYTIPGYKRNIRNKGKIHKTLSRIYGLYDLCSSQISNSRVTFRWKDVTCKKCLRLKDRKDKRKVHKALEKFMCSIHYTFDLCSGKITDHRLTNRWDRTTCKNCLRMKGKNRKEAT